MTLQIFSVTPQVWCVRRRSYLTCSYLVKTRDGIVLVDAGMDSAGRDVELGLARAFQATAADVRAVLLTHWHNDHAAGAAAIQRKSSARVYYHAGDEPQLLRSTASKGLRGSLAELIPELGPLVLFKGLLGDAIPKAVSADRLVSDGDILENDFEVIETPGHTPGHVSFYYRPERVLFAGDALAVINGCVHFMARTVTLDLVAARRSMEHCLSPQIDHLCPGHRAPLSENTQQRCQEMLARVRSSAIWPFFG